MPPSPRLRARAKKDKALARRLSSIERGMRAKGIDAPSKVTRTMTVAPGLTVRSAAARALTGQQRALAILVDFSDEPSQVAGTFFDDLLFEDVTGPASVRGYYRELSYGTLDVVTVNPPSSTGWLRMPQTLRYYSGVDYVPAGYGYGTDAAYPNNAQKMVEDAVTAADPLVDFSQYDNDSDGYVDALFVIHAGRGAEAVYPLDPGLIWSHKWNTSAPMTKDGVSVFEYSTEPEYWNGAGDMTTGVYCHEFGHVLGLPDLYDYDSGAASSYGLGDWSLMASGSWSGPGGWGGSPARLDAWSLAELGFVTPTQVAGDEIGVSIPAVDSTSAGTVFRLWPGGAISGSEYFLVENRRGRLTDSYLPGEGLLVYHVDETGYGGPRPNDDQSHYMVDVEEAHGGVQNLQATRLIGSPGNPGDPGDPFPGTAAKRRFEFSSDPSSLLYGGADSLVAVTEVSDSATTMTAVLRSGAFGHVPSLSWTGEAGYTADGVSPEKGETTSTFTFRVSYADPRGDVPPWVRLHLAKGGVEVTASPISMSFTSGDHTTGAAYATDVTDLPLGTDYTYWFEAQDTSSSVAYGPPTTARSGPKVLPPNAAPGLNWMGTGYYTSSGVYPTAGSGETTFTWRVRYYDVDNDSPGRVRVHVSKGVTEVAGSPFDMSYDGGAYSTWPGGMYSLARRGLSGGDYTYFFDAADDRGADASGAPASPMSGPSVSYGPADDVEPPAASIVAPYYSTSLSASPKVRLTWSGTDPAPSAGIGSYDVEYRVGPSGAWTPIAWLTGTSSTLADFPASAGSTYHFRTRAGDLAIPTSHVGTWSAGAMSVVPVNERSFVYRGRWYPRSYSSLYSGGSKYSSSKGAYASYRFYSARQLALVATTRRDGGYAYVYVGTRRIKVLSLYSSSTRFRQVFNLASYSAPTSGVFKIVVAGTKVRTSRGYVVEADGLAVRK
jgi:immune inhibitor A